MESRLGILSTESHTYKAQHTKGLELLYLMEEELTGGHPDRITTPAGRPEYADCKADFNISHAKNLVICSMAEGKTGCDIERADRKVSVSVAEKFFHPEEKAFLSSAETPEEKQKRFIMLWVLKEAHIKLLGSSVANIKDTPAFLIDKSSIRCLTGNSFFYSLYEGGGYMMATAFERRADRDGLKIIRYCEIPDFTLVAAN